MNFRNFWDGRANNHFNGSTPFGLRDPDAGVWELQADGSLLKVRVDLSNSSAASQAVGPPGSDFEMSCAGRIFPDIAHRILSMRGLAQQAVDPTDGVLGPFRAPTRDNGLTLKYSQMVKNAFRPKYWNSNRTVTLDPAGSTYTQMEANFALFFGIAIQEYEKTLIPDHTRFDDFAEAAFAAQTLDVPGLTDQEKHGLAIFEGDAMDPQRRFTPDGKCSRCHNGPEFSSAATHQHTLRTEGGNVERMAMNDLGLAIYDSGFYNIGVVPTYRDLGLGVTDPFGNPLSFVRQLKTVLDATGTTLDCRATQSMPVGPDNVTINCASFVEPGAITAPFRDAIDGTFKVPTLRNIDLTGPYFHNGGYATLESVVEFYNRGGNRQGPVFGDDTTGFGANGSNLDPELEQLFLTAEDQAAVVAFMKTLTDPRVVDESAPFDHPSLKVTHGHQGDNFKVKMTPDLHAKDLYLTIPAVGATGRATKGLPPVTPFLQ